MTCPICNQPIFMMPGEHPEEVMMLHIERAHPDHKGEFLLKMDGKK